MPQSSVRSTGVQKKFNAFEPDRGTVTVLEGNWYAKNYNTPQQSWAKWKIG